MPGVSGWWRDFGAARFGRPVAPRPIVRTGLLARLDRAFDEPGREQAHRAADRDAGLAPDRERPRRPADPDAGLAPERSGTLPGQGLSERAEAGQEAGSDRAAGAPVVVVVAGSGAGKSILLGQWAERRGAVLVQAEELPAEVPPGALVVVDGVERLEVGGAGWGWVVARVGVVPLVLSGREPIPVAAVDRLGAGHLAFGEDETYQVLAAALADAAGADRLAPDLHLLTGGWPGLVGLAAAWLARVPQAERAGSLRQLARVDGGLQEHLVGALVGVLDAGERELVRRLAYLPAVDAGRADVLGLAEEWGAVPPLVVPARAEKEAFVVPEPLRKTIQQRLPLAEAERQALLEAFQGM
ncbi:hypothetical protein GCM10009827_083060 [Dactylosporangium maewongense]|uniref:Uncharacterized protein n=1 Tax=Dactylosporangium maewongense TaxID=634393 RepID=A0ABN2C025_9ACTN